ncbi:MAG: hypothetical protein HYX68_27245 [Planctomycetes bacterium]|nr:hypothetical protein [Planctomycetota bacterium]
MSSEQVRILVRLKPEIEFYTVLATKVPAGYLPLHIRDHGEFYASPEMLKTIKQRDEYVHPEFPPEVREIFRRFERVFDQVYPRTVEEWEDGFRYDRRPWGEIAIWEWWADTVERFTTHLTGTDSATHEKRKDVASLVLLLSRTPADNLDAIRKGRATVDGLRTLSSGRIREIAKWMFADERARGKNARREGLRKLIQGEELPGPNRVPIDALFDESGTGCNRDADFDPTDLINSADVILGVSREDGHEFLMYGKEVLARIARTGMEESANVLRVEMDQETDDLERLAGLITMLKGRHDYGGI